MLRLGKIDLDMLKDKKALVWIFRGICYKPKETAILVDDAIGVDILKLHG